METTKKEKTKQYCLICGKEKPMHYIEFINQYVYVNCQCEEEEQKKEKEKKRKKAIEIYIKQRTKNSHVKLREADANLSSLTVDKNNEAAIKIAGIIAKMLLENTEAEEKKNGLILKGNRGSGKTYIACAVINEYNKKRPLNESAIEKIITELDNGFVNSLDVNAGSPCKIIKEDDLLRLYGRYDYRSDTTALDEFKRAEKLLVIDDLGCCNSDEKKIQAAYFNVIDYRYSQKLPTIITTNMNSTELKKYLGDRTYDRLNACCFTVNLTSEESRR